MVPHLRESRRAGETPVNSGCGIRKLVTLRRTITQLMDENDRRLPRSDDGDDDDDDDDEDEEEESPEKKEEVQR